MYRLFIKKNNIWNELDLPQNANFSFVINSPLFGQKQSGSFSFSMSLDPTVNNGILMDNSEDVQIASTTVLEFPAILLKDNKPVFGEWYFYLRDANHKGYKFDLIQNPANQPEAFYDKKLTELDFGKTQLLGSTAGVQLTNIWATASTKITDYFTGKMYYTVNRGNKVSPKKIGFFFEILVNGVVVAEPVGNDNYEWWSSYDNLSDRFNALLVIRLAQTPDYTVTCTVDRNNQYSVNVVINNDSLTINNVSMKVYNFTSGYQSGSGVNTTYYKGTLKDTFPLYNCSYPVSNRLKLQEVVANQTAYPFRFITYFNDSFYPSDDTFFEGIVNQYETATSLKLNGDFQRTSYPISPCFSLKFITEKLAEMMGFSLDASIFDSANSANQDYLGDLYLINNCDLAKQLEGTTIPYNVYADSIVYSYFMPNMTAKEFLDALRGSYCLSIDYDYAQMKMIIKKAGAVLSQAITQDFSDKVIKFPTQTKSKKKYYKVVFQGADEKVLFTDSVPGVNSLDNSKTYTNLECQFLPVLNALDLDSSLITNANEGIPTAEGAAKTVLYLDQAKNTPEMKVAMLKALSTSNIKHTISDNYRDNLSLSLTDKGSIKGIFNTFFKEYIEFLNSTEQWTTYFAMDDDEIINLKIGQPFRAYNMGWFIETFQAKFPITDLTQVKILKM